MPNLHYLIGDATDPVIKPALICHVCNSIGGWGCGFVVALSKRKKTPEEAYRAWYAHRDNLDCGVSVLEDLEGLNAFHPPFELGRAQVAPYTPGVLVANMIAQEGIHWVGKTPPIRYDALKSCLKDVYARCGEHGSLQGRTVHMPRIGCVLAGGTWEEVVKLVQAHMTVDTYVYTLPSQVDRWHDPYENAGADNA